MIRTCIRPSGFFMAFQKGIAGRSGILEAGMHALDDSVPGLADPRLEARQENDPRAGDFGHRHPVGKLSGKLFGEL